MKSFKVFREEHLEEKNVPTNPEKWARAKSAAKSKFAVYPSAYANGWASKKYKAMGGGWKTASEEVVKEDGIGIGGAVPVNNVGAGNIAGSGGKGGEPGVNTNKKKGPVLIQMAKRKPPMA